MNPTTTPSTTTRTTHHEALTMKAITHRRYGGPDVLEFDTVPRPRPAPDEVFVEVRAAGVNRGDALELRGWPYLARLMGYGATRPRRPVPGTDIAGTVIATGSNVETFDIDDEVVGWAAGGAFAEYTTAAATSVVPKPDALTFEQAVGLPTAAVAALQAVCDAASVSPGMEVLVGGASGAVGTFAVQIAAAYGTRVTGMSSGRNAELVASLGAADVIDYTRDDFTDHSGRYHAIIDLIGNQPLRQVRRALTRKGCLVVVGGQNPHSLTGMRRFASATAMSPFVSQRLVPLFSKPEPDDLATAVKLAATGKVRPVIDRTFDLTDAADAVAHVETGRSRGKVVIATGQGGLR